MCNPAIQARVIEATEFPALAQRYQVRAVPRTVVNGSHAFDGALPDEAFVRQVLSLAQPDEAAATETAASS